MPGTNVAAHIEAEIAKAG
jgi:hypothetical protein